MLREHGPPAAITQAAGMLGGPDDVGEEQRGENALHLAHRLFLTLRRVDELRGGVGGRGQLAIRVDPASGQLRERGEEAALQVSLQEGQATLLREHLGWSELAPDGAQIGVGCRVGRFIHPTKL